MQVQHNTNVLEYDGSSIDTTNTPSRFAVPMTFTVGAEFRTENKVTVASATLSNFIRLNNFFRSLLFKKTSKFRLHYPFLFLDEPLLLLFYGSSGHSAQV